MQKGYDCKSKKNGKDVAAMTRDHYGFFIFLTCLLIAPEVRIGDLFGLPGRANVSLGLVGLIIWALLSPRHLIKIKRIFYYTPAYGLIVFSAYALVISFISCNVISIVYASQFFVYGFLAFHMVSGYFKEATEHNQLSVIANIILSITIIVIFGTVFSFFFGPIYPQQAFWFARKVDDIWVQRAVGFIGNPNLAAAILLMLIPLSLSISGTGANKWRSGVILLGMLALLITISRSAILSGIIAFCIVVIIRCFRLFYIGRIRLKIIAFILLIIVIMLLIVCVLPFLNLNTKYLLGVLSIGTDVGGIGERFAIWKSWFDTWKEVGLFHQLFGAGFRSGTEISIYGTFSTPHNSYVEMLIDFGVFGLILFILPLIWTIFRALARLIIYRQADVEIFMLIGLLASAIHNMSETFFYSPNILSLIIIMLLYYHIYTKNLQNFIVNYKIIKLTANEIYSK